MDAARRRLTGTYDAAKAAGDAAAMTEAVLGLARLHEFGTHPGGLPALIHESYATAEGPSRGRLAAALARTWAYGGEAGRAAPFAAEAVEIADAVGDPAQLAEALDADLLVHWGPDDFDERIRIAARLEDVAAHLTDVDARLSAYLWRLTTALESLDMVGVHRQLHALDVLAEETGSDRVRFFEASRRAMYALLVDDLDMARAAHEAMRAAGEAAGEPDLFALDHTIAAEIARQAGYLEALRLETEGYEDFGIAKGYPSVAAQGALLWAAVGDLERARLLTAKLAGDDVTAFPRDVEWLLIVTALTEAAAVVGMTDVVAAAAPALLPFAGRAVTNAGAVTFEGVVDDYLAQACLALGDVDGARRWTESAALAYQRIGARWWLHRLQARELSPAQAAAPSSAHELVAHLRPGAGGIWTVGRQGSTVAVREMKGLLYLRLLVKQPGVDIPSLDLATWVAGHPGTVAADAAVDEVLDRRALASYRKRLDEIDDDLTEAEQWSDSERVARLHAEREALLEQLSAATGLHGRTRDTGSTAERARVAVRKALAAAIDRVAEGDGALGRLLHDTIRTGSLCRYEPDPSRPVRWVVSDEPRPSSH